MKTILTLLACVAALATTLIITGCNEAQASTAPHRKGLCTVQFRRDALGAAANLPISPMVNGINGSETCIRGTLTSSNDDSVSIKSGDKDIWIPKSVILLIEFHQE
jgi:hypothetical protein